MTRLSSDMLDELQPFLDRPGAAAAAKDAELRELWRTIGVAVVAIVLAVALFINIRVTIERYRFERQGQLLQIRRGVAAKERAGKPTGFQY